MSVDMDTKVRMLAAMVDSGEPVGQDTLFAYLMQAEAIILNRMYPFGFEDDAVVPRRYEMLQLEIAAHMIGKMGMEGELSHVENGITRGFANAGVPEDLLKQITPMGVVR